MCQVLQGHVHSKFQVHPQTTEMFPCERSWEYLYTTRHKCLKPVSGFSSSSRWMLRNVFVHLCPHSSLQRVGHLWISALNFHPFAYINRACDMVRRHAQKIWEWNGYFLFGGRVMIHTKEWKIVASGAQTCAPILRPVNLQSIEEDDTSGNTINARS